MEDRRWAVVSGCAFFGFFSRAITRRLEDTFPKLVHPRDGVFNSGFRNIDLFRHRGERRSPSRWSGRNRYGNLMCAAVNKGSFDRGLYRLMRRRVLVQYQDEIDEILDP